MKGKRATVTNTNGFIVTWLVVQVEKVRRIERAAMQAFNTGGLTLKRKVLPLHEQNRIFISFPNPL